MGKPRLMPLPPGGVLWWLLGFPPRRGWLPSMPVSLGELVVLAAVVVGGDSALVWLRNPI